MVWGEIKGFGRDSSWYQSAIICCGIAVYFCLAGYFNGFVDRAPDGGLVLHEYEWTIGTALFTAAMWLAWAVGMYLTRYYKDTQLTIGACITLSLPIALFVLFAFGLVELDFPRQG